MAQDWRVLPLAVVADTMILDLIAYDQSMLDRVTQLDAQGAIDIRITSVTERQLAAISDADKHSRIAQIPKRVVGTVGFIVGYSLLGVDRLGPSEPIEAVRTGRSKETPDALIAATAEFDGVPLVSEDVRLAAKARHRPGLIVWSYEQMRTAVFALSLPGGCS